MLAFTSPQKSYVTADPCFETGMMMASVAGARVVKVPLTKTYAHDVKAMLAAAPDAGVFYICNPNNPTGTLTSHSDIEYLVANKPKDSIVLIDEAYIHLSEAPSALDLVKAGKDVIVLRTFSKVYGMAGLRCGFVIARPDLLEKVVARGGQNFMPTTAVAAAIASLKDSALVPERRRINAGIRQQTFQWLDRNGYSYIPVRVQLLPARYEAARQGSEGRDGEGKRLDRPRLARHADLRPHHSRNARRNEPLPVRIPKSNEKLKEARFQGFRVSRFQRSTTNERAQPETLKL